jgi:hypothetical protein
MPTPPASPVAWSERMSPKRLVVATRRYRWDRAAHIGEQFEVPAEIAARVTLDRIVCRVLNAIFASIGMTRGAYRPAACPIAAKGGDHSPADF